MSISRANLRIRPEGHLRSIVCRQMGLFQQIRFIKTRPIFYLQRSSSLFRPSSQMNRHLSNLSRSSYSTSAHVSSTENRYVDSQGLHEIAPNVHPAFEFIKQEQVEELQLKATFYRHKATSAEVLSFTVPSTEREKVFTVGFRTPSLDATGVAHILEHSVLCGSTHFPVKEPFVELLKGSMYTFLNAMTYPDFTCYPCASVNDKDFYNIARVYLDAVLNPRAIEDPDVFNQEGCRVGLNEGEEAELLADKSSGYLNVNETSALEAEVPLVVANMTAQQPSPSLPTEGQRNRLAFKGVVYNEMKSVYSSPDALMGRAIHQSLHPNNSYRFDSGGDPEFISTLNFEKFKGYFEKFYHPSNSLLLFWGSDDVSKRLEFLDSFLKEVKPPHTHGTQATVSAQKSLDAPQWLTFEGPGSIENLEDMLSVNWLLDPEGRGSALDESKSNLSIEERFNLMILNWLLLGTSAGELHKVLTESGLGTQVIGGGLSMEHKHALFSVGLKGITPSKETPKIVETLVLDTLKKCAMHGFSEQAITSALNSCEFELREFNTGMLPKGLLIILRSLSEWTAGRSPVDIWRFEKPFEQLRHRLKSGEPVFENLIKKEILHFLIFKVFLANVLACVLSFSFICRFLLENTHRVTLHLVADGNYVQKRAHIEREKLQNIEKTMNADDFAVLQKKESFLQQKQMAEDSIENLNTLPSLRIEDLDKQTSEIPTEELSISNVTVLTHCLPTAGILYAELFFDLKDIPASELPLLVLYADLIKEAGTSAMSETDLIYSIGAHTGGLSTGVSMQSKFEGIGKIVDPSKILGYFGVHGKVRHKKKAMKHKSENLLHLMQSIVTDARLDNSKRAIELLKEHLSAHEAHIIQAGDHFGVKHILSEFTAAGYVSERLSGFSLVSSLRNLIKEVETSTPLSVVYSAETNWPLVEMRLRNLQNTLISRKRMLINLTGDKETLDRVLSNSNALLRRDLLEGIPESSEGTVLMPVPAFGWQSPSEDRRGDMTLPTPVEGFSVPTQVNFVNLGGRLFASGERCNSGASSVISQALTTGYLWDTIRVVGGAYGVRFRFDPISGCYCFSSHRDPSIEKTLLSYKDAPSAIHHMAQHMSSNPKALTRSIIGALRDVDRPLQADRKGQKAFWQFVQQETTADRQQYREEILQTTPSHFKEFAERLDEALNRKTFPQMAAIVASEERLKSFINSNTFSSNIHLKNVFVDINAV
ncbi:peptidase M16 inactive domain-containing protein [Cardiosporidium cionae]|uniref:Peptidase M16 inactive domain-containing protein n=1 Tax=Cardiosporidium cionae TaxID=476202 RepID=A0ABQ7JDH1_9APIC|nr:peptidase M16 inactive domain-containing protein [Cardiosporidium cionae]|eukprot:KAF8821680.1 peptidase M16 inactive domain-containing protein [Cardiosporidium cionae]